MKQASLPVCNALLATDQLFILKGARPFFPQTAQFASHQAPHNPHCFPDSQAGGKKSAGLNWFMGGTIEYWEVLIFIYLFDNLLLILFFLLCSVFVFLPLILTRFWQRDYLILTCQINWLILPTGWIYNTLTLAIWVFYWIFKKCPQWYLIQRRSPGVPFIKKKSHLLLLYF